MDYETPTQGQYEEAGRELGDIKKTRGAIAVLYQNAVEDCTRDLMRAFRMAKPKLDEAAYTAFHAKMLDVEKDAMAYLSDALADALDDRESAAKWVVEEYEEAEMVRHQRQECTYYAGARV